MRSAVGRLPPGRDRQRAREFRPLEFAAVALAAAAGTVLPAWAGPTGGTVVSGQAIIQSLSQETLIKQSTSKAIINWNIFSIFKGQSVIFQQPSSTSIALNRVLGNQPSTILGTLSANGQVWLINPNGVLFGKSATVNAAGLLATTADIANSSFLSGKYDFTTPSGNPNAGIANLGTITTPGGSTVLAAPTVDNEGTITAHLGTVALGAGKTFSVDFDGDNLLSFAVTSPAANAQVNNSGTLAADGGTVQITARAAGTIVDNVINTSGIVQANSVSIHDGNVILDGGNGGVNVTGTISTQGVAAGTKGGTVQALGNSVTLGPTATINASGQNGGGTVLVGGNFHGAGPQPNAGVVTIAQGATIEADATVNGNGGMVAVWSQQSTAFNGAITAKGGPQGGNGGYVETSSAANLSVGAGTVNTLAPNGLVGTWLLDPLNINVVASGGAGGPNDTFGNNSGGTDSINASTIDAAASNVTLQAKNLIDFQAPVSMSNVGIGITAQADIIKVESGAGITTKGGNITLSANDPGSNQSGGGFILLNAPLDTAGVNLPGGSVEITLNGASGTSNTISLGANITTAGGTITLASPTVLTSSVTLDTTEAGSNPGGTVTFASTLDDSTSNHTLTIAAGNVGNVDFEGRVGTEYQNGIDFVANSGQSPGAVIITSANAINMTVALGPNGNGFSVGEFIVEGTGSATGTTPGAASLTTTSFINTNTGGNGGLVNIVTSGAVSIGLDILTIGGSNTGNNTLGNGGAVTINAGGSIAIGGNISLTTTGSVVGNNQQVTSPFSIMTDGAGIQSAGQTPGEGGAISLTGTSIDLVQGGSANGGDATASGAIANGGRGGAISLTASTGNVTIGSAADGNLIGLDNHGGGSTGGAAGTGGDVTLSGTTLSFTSIHSSKELSAGGDITLIATATSGPAITVYGNADNSSTTTVGVINGDFAIEGRNIAIESGTDGHGNPLPLQGTAYIQLADNSANAQNYGGPTVEIATGGGSIYLGGPIQGTLGTEGLRLFAVNGSATVTGAVGDPGGSLSSTKSLGYLVLSCCGVDGSGNPNPTGPVPTGSSGGTITFDGPVTAANIIDERLSGSVTFDGLVTATNFTMPASATTSLALLGGGTVSGALASGAGPTTLGGNFTTTATQTYNGAVTLSANTSLTSSGSGAAGNIVFASTVSGPTFSLTLDTGGTITAAGGVNLGAFILQGGNWSQLGSPLPSFQATDFELQGGTFLRALAGDGSSGNPYQLADIYGVQGMGTLLTDDFVLANNIDASGTSGWNGGAGFMPIGGVTAFSGSLDGQGHTISALSIDSGAANVGLFAMNSGTIANLVLNNVTIVSTGTDAAAGALAGTNNGLINNVSATGTVSGQSTDGGDAMLGGLVGFNSSSGTIQGGSFANVAVSDTVNYGDDYLGGLVGHNEGMLFQTDATGPVTGTGAGVENGWGGLVGVLDSGTISQSFATGNVTNNGDAEPNMGGLVGKQNGGSIVNSFATGAVITTAVNGGIFMGGLVGWQTGGSIATSFSIGLVQCPGQGCSQGGMIGVGGGTVDGASFWDAQSSGQASSAGGAGLTTAQAESASFLESIGWNFSGATNIQNGSSFPFLQWFGHPITPTEIVSGLAPDGATVDLLIDGVSSGQVTAASNGVFDFSLPSGTSGVALAYLPSGSADAVSPLSGAGAAGLTLLTSNAVTLQGQGGPVQVSMLNTAEGVASGTGLLYRAASNTVTLNPNISLTVTGGAGNVTVDNAIVASGTGLVTISGAGIALAANITSGLGFVLASPVTLNNSVTLTGGIGIAAFASTVNTGTNNIVVVADQVTLASNQPWLGTGTRTLYPFTANSPITLAPNEGTTPALFSLTTAELADLAGGAPAMVTIGSSTAPASGALTTGDFTFDVPITLVGSSITIDPLTKNDSALTLASSGAVTGSIVLGTGTGTLTASAGSLDMTGTVNGASGAAAVPFIALVQPLGAGPFLFNGVNILSPTSNNTGNNSTNTNNNAAATTIAQSTATTSNPAPTSPPPFNVTNTALPVDFADNQQSAAATPIDSGATLFETISPTAPTDLSVSASGSDATLIAYANPAPVTAAVNGTVPPPRVVRSLGQYVGETLTPTVPRRGVPGVSFGYSLTGNSALW